MLDRHVEVPHDTELGEVVTRKDIRSSLGPFHHMPRYTTTYPAVVIEALGELYSEYNRMFAHLVEANRESETDYQHCMAGHGSPVNYAVQIDMVGLPDSFLQEVSEMSVAEVREILRGRIFEIENSLAMYQLLERIFENGHASFFKTRYRAFLDSLRNSFDRPIALLAVTVEKYEAMLTTEFGVHPRGCLTDKEVKDLTGFDAFLSPEAFAKHVSDNNGSCRYLLYARTSDPVAKLKDPEFEVDHPLLGDPSLRKVIKENSLTFNVDDPSWPISDRRRINDSKGYMNGMRMAFPIVSEEDLFSRDFVAHLQRAKAYADYKGERLSPGFKDYLRSRRVDPEAVVSGAAKLRCKPAQGAYGCYGHVTGALGDRDFRKNVRGNLRNRGPYVVQPEFLVPTLTNSVSGQSYRYIDRNFMAMVGGAPQFLGGFRSMMPATSHEAAKGRNHGNSSTVFAEILG